jgi:putative ABC transport system permease protein
MFPEAIELLRGSFLRRGQAGLLLSEEAASELSESANQELNPGDRVLLTATTQAGIKVREVPITGIFRFYNNLSFLEDVSFVDIMTLRSLVGMTVSAPADQILTDDQLARLGSVDENDLFSGGGGIVQEVEASPAGPILIDLGGREEIEVDSGAWHFLLLKLRRPGAIARVTADLQKIIADQNLNAQVMDWSASAAPLSLLSDGFKTVFNVVIIVIAVVAVIIIMNTLVISVTERISEIGTMRAIGASKRFIRQMIGSETVTLAVVFGCAGVALGMVLLLILGATGIRASNTFLRILFGGEVLSPEVSAGAVAFSLIMVVVIAIVASLYPLVIALRISPRQAMGNE